MIAAAAQAFDKTKRAAPSHYLRRHPSQRDAKGHLNWQQCEWGKFIDLKNFAEAEKIIAGWNTSASGWEYRLPLHCERCYNVVQQETYPAVGLGPQYLGKHVCLTCHMEGIEMTKKPLLLPLHKATEFGFTKPVVHKEGDIWKLPKSNSPMWTEQWGYQGSSKTPYVISHKSENINTNSMTPDGWACSCPNFTRHTPRTPCKHILNVMLKEGDKAGFPVSKSTVKLANQSDKDLAEFENWKREKAAAKTKPTAGNASLNIFGSTGRKFR